MWISGAWIWKWSSASSNTDEDGLGLLQTYQHVFSVIMQTQTSMMQWYVSFNSYNVFLENMKSPNLGVWCQKVHSLYLKVSTWFIWNLNPNDVMRNRSKNITSILSDTGWQENVWLHWSDLNLNIQLFWYCSFQMLKSQLRLSTSFLLRVVIWFPCPISHTYVCISLVSTAIFSIHHSEKWMFWKKRKGGVWERMKNLNALC